MKRNNPNIQGFQEAQIMALLEKVAENAPETGIQVNQFSIQVDNRQGFTETEANIKLTSQTERLKITSAPSEMCDITDEQIELMVKLIESMPERKFDHIIKCIFVTGCQMVDKQVELAELLGITEQKMYSWLGRFGVHPKKDNETD